MSRLCERCLQEAEIQKTKKSYEFNPGLPGREKSVYVFRCLNHCCVKANSSSNNARLLVHLPT